MNESIPSSPLVTRSNISMRFSKWLPNFPITAVVALIVFFTLYPVIWIYLSSFKSSLEFNSSPMWALPQGLEWGNYVQAWTKGHMSTYFTNSLLTVIPSLLIVLGLGVSTAFGIEIMQWRYKDGTALLFLAGIMVPIQVVLLPLFTMFFKLGLLDTRWSLILLYVTFGLPLTVFFLTGYFKSFSREVIEAAIVDGANIYQVFFLVALPMVMNAVVTVAVVQFFFMWNDLLVSLTFISNPELRTVQSGLLSFVGQFGQRDWGPTFASMALAVTPTVVVYLFLNQMVMKGMAAGAVKG
jgi:raffinose/stachyose/melibiose transport system permease protein